MTAHRSDTALGGRRPGARPAGRTGPTPSGSSPRSCWTRWPRARRPAAGRCPRGGPGGRWRGGYAGRWQRTRTRGTRAGAVLPEHGTGAEEALRTLVRAVAEGAADPADPWCAAHLHCPPLAVAAAADLAAAALNPSMDSWDQAPAATALEQEVTRALAALVHPGRAAPDALVTSGGTESNLVALLLARERALGLSEPPCLRVVCGTNAHHSVRRAAWVLGLADPVTVPCRDGRLDPGALPAALAGADGPGPRRRHRGHHRRGAHRPAAPPSPPRHAGTAPSCTSTPRTGAAALQRAARAPARRAGGRRVRHLRPAQAGLAAGRRGPARRPRLPHCWPSLELRADYLNADDDTEAGLPDLLGRSLRTTRRPDVLKIAATPAGPGRTGLGALVEHRVAAARNSRDASTRIRRSRRRPGPIGISTVLFRPPRRRRPAAGAGRRPGGGGPPPPAGRGQGRRRTGRRGRRRRAPAAVAQSHAAAPAAAGADLAGLLDLVAGAAAAAATAPGTRTPHHPPEGTR